MLHTQENFNKIKSELNIKEKSFENLIIFPLIITTSFQDDGIVRQSTFNPNMSISKISLFELKIILLGEDKFLLRMEDLDKPKITFPKTKPRLKPQKIIKCIIDRTIWNNIIPSSNSSI